MALRFPLDVGGPTPAAGARARSVPSLQQGWATMGRPGPWGMPNIAHRLVVNQARVRCAAPPSWRPCDVCLKTLACGAHARGARHGDIPRPNAVAYRPCSDPPARLAACHVPPGTSMWHTSAQRMFGRLANHWRGRPVISCSVIVTCKQPPGCLSAPHWIEPFLTLVVR